MFQYISINKCGSPDKTLREQQCNKYKIIFSRKAIMCKYTSKQTNKNAEQLQHDSEYVKLNEKA